MNVNVTKTVPIEFKWVVDAYAKVRQGGKATGIDEESWTDFAKNVEQNLYLIWNRLASGSYYPQAVRSVEIPKKDGTMRMLGIPTLRDRIAQQVIKEYMEKRIDRLFHEHSYGYRPMKSAHQALQTVLKNCYAFDFVIDMDIRKFFDEIDHELLLKAVEHVLPEKWISFYVKRWLEAPTQDENGVITPKQGMGTPQGGVISPLLANLYLHFTFDKWLEKHFPTTPFVRYADDAVVHCRTKEEAEQILEAIKQRLNQVKLSIKESKTKIAYCKDYKRKQSHEHVQFDFLGFSFKPLRMTGKPKDCFTGFGAVISSSNRKKLMEIIREEKVFKNTAIEIKDIAVKMNSRLRGWINYYLFKGKRSLNTIMDSFDERLIKWIKKKYKIQMKAARRKLNAIKQKTPKLFYHWEVGIC